MGEPQCAKHPQSGPFVNRNVDVVVTDGVKEMVIFPFVRQKYRAFSLSIENYDKIIIYCSQGANIGGGEQGQTIWSD